MYPLYILPPLPHQYGMVARPEFGHPTERRNEVPCDHAERRPILPRCPGWVREGNPSMFDLQTGDCYPGDLFHSPLKEVREEYFP